MVLLLAAMEAAIGSTECVKLAIAHRGVGNSHRWKECCDSEMGVGEGAFRGGVGLGETLLGELKHRRVGGAGDVAMEYGFVHVCMTGIKRVRVGILVEYSMPPV